MKIVNFSLPKKYFTGHSGAVQRMLLVVLACAYSSLYSMVYDNRYLPLLQKLLVKKSDACGQLMIQPFAWVGDESLWDDFGSEEPGGVGSDDIPLFNINGLYNQVVLDRALKLSGQIPKTTFRSDFVNNVQTLRWAMEGIIRGQGIGFTFYQPFTRHFSWGFNFFFAHLTSALRFKPDRHDIERFSSADLVDIYDENNLLQDILHLPSREYSTTGISDIELYLRFGIVEDYKYRMRHIDAGFNFGALFPSAEKVNYYNPASIPLGGNGHWGIFASVDGQFELKENIGVGVLLRINKRFAQKAARRMIQLTEPNNYGVLYGGSEVNPGVTVIFSPYGQLLRLRSGFGLQAQYTLVYHQEDHWRDLCSKGRIPANVGRMECRSQWASEYVNIAAIYDMAKDSKERTFKPIITFAVDVPVQFLIAKRVAKTFGISLTVESTLW